MIVFHGSTIEIPKPLVAIGRDKLDFGKGFYVTDIQQQAEQWAKRVSLFSASTPVINVYEILEDAFLINYKKFTEYNEEWLDFIVANRQGNNPALKYDIIEGGVADDRVIDSIEAFMAGFMPKDLCLRRLAEHQPNNQICILNQDTCDKYLKFIKSYKI